MFGSQWFAELWPVAFQELHINIMELFPIVLAVEIWGHKMANHKVLFYSDNKATVYTINKQTSKEKFMMKLIRRLVLFSLKYNI